MGYPWISDSAYLSHARATRTAASMMSRHRSSRLDLKPGRRSSAGHRFGERYSGKVSSENSAVGLAQSRVGST